MVTNGSDKESFKYRDMEIWNNQRNVTDHCLLHKKTFGEDGVAISMHQFVLYKKTLTRLINKISNLGVTVVKTGFSFFDHSIH